MSLPVLLASTAMISISGVLAPGPVTAVTLGHGSRDRHAGALVAVGHAMIELPLVVVLAVGLGGVLGSGRVRAMVGLAGGACLVWMGISLLRSARHAPAVASSSAERSGPLSAGLLLSATNPYFYLWWLSVGMALVLQASSLGPLAVTLFFVVHWLCDLAWLWLLSALSFQGSNLFGARFQTGAFLLCGLALAVFGVKFVTEAVLALGH
jgi:threonine/homoserine/homoserine lactone efflux protein